MWLECGKEVWGHAELEGQAGSRAGRLGFHYVGGKGQGEAGMRGAENVSGFLRRIVGTRSYMLLDLLMRILAAYPVTPDILGGICVML